MALWLFALISWLLLFSLWKWNPLNCKDHDCLFWNAWHRLGKFHHASNECAGNELNSFCIFCHMGTRMVSLNLPFLNYWLLFSILCFSISRQFFTYYLYQLGNNNASITLNKSNFAKFLLCFILFIFVNLFSNYILKLSFFSFFLYKGSINLGLSLFWIPNIWKSLWAVENLLFFCLQAIYYIVKVYN